MPTSRNKLGSSCEGSEDKRAGEVLLFYPSSCREDVIQRSQFGGGLRPGQGAWFMSYSPPFPLVSYRF